MSKSIRIKDYLYEQIERLAEENRRPLIGQLEILLEQALKIEDSGRGYPAEGVLPVDADQLEAPAPRSENPYKKEFKPDFKPVSTKKKR